MRVTNILIVFLCIMCIRECTKFQTIDSQYQLVAEAYNIAQRLFNRGRTNFGKLKEKSLHTIDTFLDLVNMMNEEMSKEMRSAVLKFYRIKHFYDFANSIIGMDELVDIIEHCLADPNEKLQQIRSQFHEVVKNFEDVRNFDTVERCHQSMPDEVAVAHCILHQAVLFNETMQENLVTIVETKMRQHAQDMNSSIYSVQSCIHSFVPKFFEQLLLDAYTDSCGYLKVVNASIADLLKDKWRGDETIFPKKWSPLVHLLKRGEKLEESIEDSQFLSGLTINNWPSDESGFII